jgi:sarcosine oxidase subunit alpha
MPEMKFIPGIEPGPAFEFTFGGKTLSGFEGESVASALMRAGILAQRLSPKRLAPRGYYCGMGLCWECAVDVEGEGVVRSCGFPLRPDLNVRMADGDLA